MVFAFGLGVFETDLDFLIETGDDLGLGLGGRDLVDVTVSVSGSSSMLIPSS
jgi:hypothetical protein